MDYSNGMGFEIQQWVITTRSAKRFWSVKENKFINDVTEDCLFGSSNAANKKLNDLDVGYIVKKVRVYMDASTKRISLS